MEVITERQDGVLWVRVSGRIDRGNAMQFEEAVANAMEDGDQAVIMDLENLVFIGRAGRLAVILTAKSLLRRDVTFALCALSDAVRQVFEVSGIDRIVAIHPTRAKALASLDR